MHAGRRRGKTRSRLLYWFRTPPGVRVGRAALDEDAIRLIEQHNPDVEFDWTRILKSQVEEPKPPPSRERFDRGRRRPDQQRTVLIVPAEPAVGPDAPVVVVRQPEPNAPAMEPADFDVDVEPIGIGVADGESIAALDDGPAAEPPSLELLPPTAAHARLGSEGVLRLRARYSEVLARISERIQDPVRQEQLKTQAERLNPDTWVTDAEVSAGLEEYEIVFEALRGVIGGQIRRRRRKRRGGQQPPQTVEATAADAGTIGPDEADGEDEQPEDT